MSYWGRKVLEIRPPIEIDKGRGIISFLQWRRRSRPACTSVTT